ncbi:MAG: twin-arginine translocase TatA/TatE family subunit [Deltaproteobacteria bacterium]|nr:twin-arginine translocase TatA/TatE family subunit [Deltaproteobacteria bacterium]
MGIGWSEWLIILLVVMLLFGAGRLPALGKSLGEGFRNLKKGLSGEDDDRAKLPAEEAKDEKKA